MRSIRTSMALVIVSSAAALTGVVPAGAATTRPQASGAPGAKGIWTPADKHGFGTSHTNASKVWFTMRQASLTEVYYPDLNTPAIRDLRFAVTTGNTVAYDDETGTSTVKALDDRSLSFRQTTTTAAWTLTKTVITDPARDAVLIKVRFQPADPGMRYKLYAVLDPALSNSPDDDRGATSGGGLVAWDDHAAVALQAPGIGDTTSAYAPATGIVPIQGNGTDASAQPGNVVQAAQIPSETTVALGFAPTPSAATTTAKAALNQSFDTTRGTYDAGWHAYLSSLSSPPKALPTGLTGEYDRSVLVLAASEDKSHPGAGVASPTMPWAWGLRDIDDPSDAYHLTWARDLYQVATAQLAAGDAAAANRALDFLFGHQQKDDGSFPQNSLLDGTPRWSNTQLDEVADPILLAWELNRRDAPTYSHVKRAADYIMANGPITLQERWENQGGYSPATIAAEIAGLVTAADLATANGDGPSATAWLATADDWQSKVQGWTATTNGPYDPKPYYLRLTKDGTPDVGTKYGLGDGGPSSIDQRAVVDPSFLELVRLGIKPANDPVIQDTIKVVDDHLGVTTKNGTYWHRYTDDGYGETATGGPWDLTAPDTHQTIGRAWPIFAGERGEYELLAGQSATTRLRAIANAGNDGGMLPEQVWDQNPPSGQSGFTRGEGTFSATPLAWTHAQFVRLAWSMQAGHPVEQPSVVACRYARPC